MTGIAPLTAVVEQPEFREELDRLCRAQWQWGTPQEVRTAVLKAHERRCVFELSVKTPSGWYGLIAKTYRRDRADVFDAMAAFAAAGFGPEATFGIPRPMAHLPAWGLRLEEKIPGPTAKEVLLSAGPEARTALAGRCARWLARFQRKAPPRLGRELADPAAEAARWAAWVQELAVFGEPLAGKARRLQRDLEAATPAPGTLERCAAHGSYIPGHVVASGGRTVAIDLDRYGVADPAREAAGFGVALQRLALKERGLFRALDTAGDAFLAAYAEAAPSRALTHYAFYRAVECLQRARRDVHGRTPPQLEWAEIMLDEGLAALEERR